MSINYTPEAEDYQEGTEKRIIPDGTEVNLRFTDAKFITNDRGWKGLKLSGIITDGEFANQFMDEMVTLENPNNPATVKYGRQTQAKLCKALGLGGITHESQLLGLPVVAVISDISSKNPDFPNKIKAYKVHPHNVQAQGAPVQQAPAQAAPAQQYQAPPQQAAPVQANPFGGQPAPADNIPF
jgi:hypothetical protein